MFLLFTLSKWSKYTCFFSISIFLWMIIFLCVSVCSQFSIIFHVTMPNAEMKTKVFQFVTKSETWKVASAQQKEWRNREKKISHRFSLFLTTITTKQNNNAIAFNVFYLSILLFFSFSVLCQFSTFRFCSMEMENLFG